MKSPFPMRRCPALVALLLLSSLPPIALGMPRPARAEAIHDGAARELVPRNALSIKLVGLGVSHPHDSEAGDAARPDVMASDDGESRSSQPRLGLGLGYERALIPGWLNAELDVLAVPGEHGLTLPIDVYFKKPFETTRNLETFVGLGVATEWIEEGRYAPAAGLGSTLGAGYWLGHDAGLVLEAEYNLLLTPENVHELVVAAGASLRF